LRREGDAAGAAGGSGPRVGGPGAGRGRGGGPEGFSEPRPLGNVLGCQRATVPVTPGFGQRETTDDSRRPRRTAARGNAPARSRLAISPRSARVSRPRRGSA